MECVYKKTDFLFKFLPCFLATIIAFMTLYGSFVYASSYDSTLAYNEQDYTIIMPDNISLNYLVGVSPTQGGAILVYSSEPIYFQFSAGLPYLRTLNNTNFYYKTISGDSNTYLYDFSSYSLSDFTTKNNDDNFRTGFLVRDFVLLSSYDVLDSEGDLVFQAPPHQVEGIIAEQTQGVQMDKILQEILGILPIVLAVIVGILAIRKAIQFLMARMKKA